MRPQVTGAGRQAVKGAGETAAPSATRRAGPRPRLVHWMRRSQLRAASRASGLVLQPRTWTCREQPLRKVGLSVEPLAVLCDSR